MFAKRSTVTAEASQVQFSTSKLETAVEARIAEGLPQLYRSPFVLATLDPPVLKNDRKSEYNPFNSWGPGHMSIGGGAELLQRSAGRRKSRGHQRQDRLCPYPDMVQEVVISQNTVDAEFGHGSGSAISIVTKDQARIEFHGECLLLWPLSLGLGGIRPCLPDHQPRPATDVRGNLGHPILKNRLFNFVSYEGWKWTQAAAPYTATLPTAAERTGDFSRSINASGATECHL